MPFYSYGSSYCWPSLVHIYFVDYWFNISVFWVMDIISHVLFNIIWFSLVWPLTASFVGVSVEVARSSSCRIPCCKHLFGHTVSHEISRFSAPEAIVIASIILARVCFFLLFFEGVVVLLRSGLPTALLPLFQHSCWFLVRSLWTLLHTIWLYLLRLAILLVLLHKPWVPWLGLVLSRIAAPHWQ